LKKLHQLIHSLSRSEKRFVKVRLNGNKSDSSLNNHFDQLSKQKIYNFDELLQLENKSKKLLQSNLSLLFEVILKHLRSINASKSIPQTLRGDLQDVNTLMDKSLYDEALIQCLKLIKKAESREEFDILKTANKDLWNLYLLKGDLGPKITKEIQENLKLANKKEALITSLEAIYREATTIYYQYFFDKRAVKYQDQIKEATKELGSLTITSAKAKHIYYEIRAIKCIVLGVIEEHHQIRKEQFLHLVSSVIFEQDNLHKLLVLSNIFTFLKSKAYIKELKAYLDFMEDYFQSELVNKNDSVFMEKFYDIYISNQSFLQVWAPNTTKISELTTFFKTIIHDHKLSNPLLAGRVYVNLVELKIITSDYKASIPLLVEFFHLSKKKKHSKLYIEGDLHFLVANYLMDKFEIFESHLDAFNRKIKRNELELNEDQNVLLQLLNSIIKEDLLDLNFYVGKIKHRQSYKTYIHKLMTKESDEIIRSKYFPGNDPDYIAKNDDFLCSIQDLIK